MSGDWLPHTSTSHSSIGLYKFSRVLLWRHHGFESWCSEGGNIFCTKCCRPCPATRFFSRRRRDRWPCLVFAWLPIGYSIFNSLSFASTPGAALSQQSGIMWSRNVSGNNSWLGSCCQPTFLRSFDHKFCG